jgi:PAS domain S-box-containing protein
VDLVLLGNLIPIAGSVVSLTALRDNPVRDLSPLTFALGNLVVAWGLFRHQLFDVVPVARDAVIESIEEALFVLDSRDRLVDLNPAARRLLGPKAPGSIGRPAEELVSDWARMVERRPSGSNRPDITTVHEAGTVRPEPEVLHLQTHEDHRILEINSYALRDDHGNVHGRIVLCRDVTARARLEQELHVHRERLEDLVEERTSELRAQVTAREQAEAQLRQAQKMEAVGRMAGGIAHDFNNRLQALTLTIEELAATMPALAQSDEYAQLIREIGRATELIARLMLFSRRQPLSLQELDLNEAISTSLTLVQRAVGPTVEVVTDLTPGLWPIRGDAVQLDQVLLNLAINARDAMPEGGRLTLATRNVRLRGTDPAGRSSPSGEGVSLEVTDTGCGMDAEVQEHAFDPFFTTKPPGKGTGLGLSTVYGIVQQSNGSIAVRSSPGAGATFTLTFPRATPSPPLPEPVHSAGAASATTERATILLVEDEDGIRRAGERLLARAGFDVLVAADGGEALRQFDASSILVHLVVTDLAMPGIGGRTLVRELRERRPDLPVLVVSGDADQAANVRAIGGPTHFLAKPFLFAELIEAVQRLLAPVPH